MDIKSFNMMLMCDPMGSGLREDIDFFGIKVGDFGLALRIFCEYAITGGHSNVYGSRALPSRMGP